MNLKAEKEYQKLAGKLGYADQGHELVHAFSKKRDGSVP